MWIEVFKAGTQTDSAGNKREWTEADLQSIAAKYNEQQAHDAPATIGHPLDNSPAYGWVDALKAVGDTLYAKFRDMHSDFVQMVNDKRFPKRSIALYDDGLLRHIGFLGAAPPAVKGMPDVKLTFSAEKKFNALNAEFSEGACSEAEPLPPKAEPVKEPVKTEPPAQSFSRQARAAVWGISAKQKGHDDIPSQYSDLLPENFADPVNLRFPMDKRFMPAVLGTWKRDAVREEYTEKERDIITARIVGAAVHYGYNLTKNSFLEVPPQLLSKSQLVKVVTGAAGIPAQNAATKQSQPIQPTQTIPQTKFEEGIMPLEQLQAMLEELLGFASDTFGEETANQLAAKIQELQDKYKSQNSGESGAAAGAPPAGGAAMSETEKQLRARVEQLEATNRLAQHEQFCEALIQKGALLPAQKGTVLQLLVNSHSSGSYQFSENNKTVEKPLTDAFKGFLQTLKQIEFSEQGSKSRVDSNIPASGDTAEDVLHKKVLTYMEEAEKAGNKSITYDAAFTAVIKKERNV